MYLILYRIRTKFYYHVYVVKPKTLLDKVTADVRKGVRGNGGSPNTFIYCDICEKKKFAHYITQWLHAEGHGQNLIQKYESKI